VRARATGGAELPPGWPERVLYGSLVLLAVVGLASPGRYNALPAESILELSFVAVVLLSGLRWVRGAWPLFVLGGGYLGLKVLLLVLYGSAGALDFLQAYKSFYYVVLLAFLVGKQRFGGPRLARFVVVLVGAFLLKYAYSVVLGLDPRPGLYVENNFELIMLIGLCYLAWPHLGRARHLVFAGVTATVLLSGSRSAALGLVFTYAFLYLRRSNRLWPLHVAGLAGVGWAVLVLFDTRAAEQGPGELDRVQFLHIFLYEVRDWPIWEFLTGSLPLTPLSPGSCASLSYWSVLFSHSDPGTCYSVILHSFFLRAVFDHGLLGLGLLYALVWIGLRRSRVRARDAVALLGLITISGFSVSAFNNVFVAILLGVAMALARARPPGPGAPPPAAGLRAGATEELLALR
jgi:hypothetical protein